MQYENKYPRNVKKMVAIDVGIIGVKHMTLKTILMIMYYQIWLAISFAIACVFGETVGKLTRVPLIASFVIFPFLSPIG